MKKIHIKSHKNKNKNKAFNQFREKKTKMKKTSSKNG